MILPRDVIGAQYAIRARTHNAANHDVVNHRIVSAIEVDVRDCKISVKGVHGFQTRE